MTNRCLESAVRPNSLFQRVLAALQSSNGGVSPVRMMKATCAGLANGDILVMDGQCQGEFFHSTDPGREQEWINVTFRWIKQHVSSCPLFKAGVACCLPTCAQGSSVHVMEDFGQIFLFGFLASPGALCILGVLVLLVIPLVCTRLGSQRCASCWTRPVGGGRWEHYLCFFWGVCWATQKSACQNSGWVSNFIGFKLYMPALVRWPSLHSCDACMVYWVQGASRGKLQAKTR